MTYLKNLVAIFLLFTVCGVVTAQNNADASGVSSALKNLFDYAQKNNLKSAAGLILYTGNDTERNFSSALNIKNKNEKNEARRVIKKINALLVVSDKHNFGNVVKKNDMGIDKFVVPVEFYSGGQKLVTEFYFVKLNDKFLLQDIN